MIFSSKWKKNQIRLINLHDMKVFQGWPNVKTNLNLVEKFHLSEKNQVIIGNNKGHISMYELNN